MNLSVHVVHVITVVSSDYISMSCHFHADPGDFTSMNTTIIFMENEASKILLNITIIDDSRFELMESFHVNMILLAPNEPEHASRITIFCHQTNISIQDDDSKWSFTCMWTIAMC